MASESIPIAPTPPTAPKVATVPDVMSDGQPSLVAATMEQQSLPPLRETDRRHIFHPVEGAEVLA